MHARGALTGGLVAVAFGLVFVLVNSGGLGPWTVALRVAGTLVAALLVVDLLGRLLGPSRDDPAGSADPAGPTDPAGPGGSPWSRGYWWIVVAEAVALFGGVQVVVRVLDAPRYAIAWVAFVVGVHFVGLGLLWRLTRFHVLGAVMVALAAVAVVAGAAGGSDAAVRLVAGVGCGATLLAFAALAGRPGPAPSIRTPARST